MDDLKIVTLNVRGLRSNKKYNIYRWLRDNKFDICLLQETFCTEEYDVIMKKGWRGEMVHSFSNSGHSRGVSILFAKDFTYSITSKFCDNEGRMLLVNLEVNGVDYSICNIYSPNDMSERIKFLQNMKLFVQNHAVAKNNIYIGGDFNCVESPLDRASRKLDRSSTVLAEIKNDLKLIDVWRSFNPDKREFSYIDPSVNGRHSRIDFWLIPKVNIIAVNSCSIVQAPTPDHKAVVINIKKYKKPRGKGYWKMNNSVIDDTDYKDGITSLYNETIEQYNNTVSKALLWDYLKIKIKEFTTSYCISKARSRKHLTKDIEEKLDCIDKSDKKDEKILERKLLKQQLDTLYEQRAKGYHIRSRAKWVEDGEKSSSYFLNLEKSRQAHNTISCLKDSEGKTQHSDDDILHIARSFYEKLYASNMPSLEDIESYFDTVQAENKLDDDAQQKCEGPVSYTECTKALTKMKKN